MFVVHLTYLVPLDQVDEALEAHRHFLDEHFAAGVFVAAGPKVPRDGGVIVATNVDRAQLGAILARGESAGLFRANIDPLRLYVTLSGMGYYIVSNRFTLAATLGRDFSASAERAEMVQLNTEMLLAYLMRK